MHDIARSYSVDPFFPNTKMTVESQFLDDPVYLEIVRKTVVACTDSVFVLRKDNSRIDEALWLSERNVYPMKGTWVIGGRMFFNDASIEHSSARCVKRETGVDIDPSRFVPFTTNFYAWGKVAQGDFPGKNLVAFSVCIVSEAEKDAISAGLTKAEYTSGFGLQRFDRERLEKENCHPMLIDVLNTLFPSPEERARRADEILKNTWWQR